MGMMTEEHVAAFDLCVIGCGPGGFTAAMRAVDLGRRVCVVESGRIGGAGVMWGALASKTLWELGKDYAVAALTDRGYRAEGLRVDYPAVRATVLRAVEEKASQMLRQLQAFPPPGQPGRGTLTLKRGRGEFSGTHHLRIIHRGGGTETIRADYFLIATGSLPRRIPGMPVDHQRIIDSNGILRLTQFPRRLMIVGGGITGCEYATIFANFGQTRVTLVDHQARILPHEDADISAYVARNLERKGVVIHHSATLKDIEKQPDGLSVTLGLSHGQERQVAVDVVLFSIGRKPNLSALKLENAGVGIDAAGYLETDGNCCVTGHIYAAGDVTHLPNLVNMAELEGRYAVKHMFSHNRGPLQYSNMPTIMFFYPQVAAVGMNERVCRREKIPYRVAYYSNALLSRAIAMRSMDGFVKIIVSDDKSQRVLGMRAAGPQASNTIMSIAMVMDQEKGLGEVFKTVRPHPTMAEGVPECLRLLLGKSAYKPDTFPDLLKLRAWHPDTGETTG